MNVDGGPRPGSQPATGGCPLCGHAVANDVRRCPACGMFQTVGAGRNPFGQASVWAMAGGLAVVYLLTLLVVALAR